MIDPRSHEYILRWVREWAIAEEREDRAIAAGDRALANRIFKEDIQPIQRRILELAGYEDVYERTHGGRKRP